MHTTINLNNHGFFVSGFCLASRFGTLSRYLRKTSTHRELTANTTPTLGAIHAHLNMVSEHALLQVEALSTTTGQ